MDNISFQYPTWYLLLCLLLGLAFSLLLYYRSPTFREQSNWLNGALGLLRFLSVSLIAILLLSPLLRRVSTDVQKPIIVLAQDVSESSGQSLGDDRSNYLRQLDALSESLSDDYEFRTYSFGSELREGIDTAFSDKQTNLSDAVSGLYSLYSGQNLGAVIMATDGIYNKGSNPLYANAKLSAPLYTVALGDTTPQRDLLVKRVFHNRIVYLGDKFSIQVDLAAENAAGTDSRLSIYKVESSGTRLLQQEAIKIDRNSFFATREFVLDTDAPGIQRYRLVLSEVPGEASTANNTKDIFIEVLDARQKVLILANAPHPDVTALRQSLAGNKNYELTASYIAEFKGQPAAYDFIILHNLPSVKQDAASVFNAIRANNIPHLFVAGLQTNLQRLNELQNLVSIRSRGASSNEVQAALAPGFGLFKLSDRLYEQLPNFPPLTAAFGDFSLASNANPLLYQRIGKVDTRYPLLVLGEQGNSKVGVLCAEGIWKWRLFDFLQHQDHELYNELISKTVQYLSLKEDKRRYRVSMSKNIFDENETIYFDAELYNRSFELVNEPDAELSVTDDDGKAYSFTFNKTDDTYRLNAGILPVGGYRFSSNVFYDGERLAYEGQFSVQPIQLENYETTADHNTLRLLSEKFGGQLLYPSELEQVEGIIRNKDTVKPVIYETAQTQLALNLKWIFFLILGLLSLEWLGRRYFGAY